MSHRSRSVSRRPLRTCGLLALLALLAAPAACGSSQRKEVGAKTGPTRNEPTAADAIALLPRDLFFGNPDRAGAKLSPDGTQLAYLAPVDGVLNVWVAPVNEPEKARAITQDTHRGIRRYEWTFLPDRLVFLQDDGGDENFRLHIVDVKSGQAKALTPAKARVELYALSDRKPSEIRIGLNHRDPQFHDVVSVDLTTGELTTVYENKEFTGFTFDNDLALRLADKMTTDGGMLISARGKKGFVPFLTVPPADLLNTGVLGFDATGKSVYLFDSRGRDTTALFSMDVGTQKPVLLGANDKADAASVVMHPTERRVQAVAFERERMEWTVLDDSIRADLEYLRTVSPGDVTVTSRTLDDATWVVVFEEDAGPAKTFVYRRGAKPQATLLFSSRKDLEGVPLVPMRPVVIAARDGLELVSYLSLPPSADGNAGAAPAKPMPLVLLVHGGPWARDSWGFDPQHQWLANRGYAVLSVNFRGSTGFGKSFVNAGDKEWGRKMHDDLIDAVNWAIAQGIAQPDKIAIMGGSYGGYATLIGLTFTPDTFACGVAIVGPSNLATLLETIPPYWKPMMELFATRVGDPRTDAGKRLLAERSPLNYVEHIKKPLLIGQGANDPRVKQSESDQIVDSMESKSIPVTYVLFPDEGHGFARPENRMAFYAVTESFLAGCLGGRAEPVGDAFVGSSIQIKAGASHVPGLPSPPTK